MQGHVLSTGNCSKLFQGQRRSAVSVKSPWHTYCFLGFWSLTLTGFQAYCHLLFAVGCSQQLYHFNCLQLPPRQSTRYLLFKSIIYTIYYYIYLSDLNKTLLFWRPVRFAGIMHSGGSLGLGVTAPTRAANHDPFSLSMLVSREIEFCSLVLVLVLVRENPKNK